MVDRPIFLIGTGRCGTTVIFEALSLHEELAWFSNYNDRFPRMAAASAAPRIYQLPLLRRLPRGEKPQFLQGTARFNRLLPKPSECYRKWQVLCGSKFRRDFLVGIRATPAERRRVRNAVRSLQWWQGKPRFSAKITGPPRIEYLHSIFPDSRFVHIVRQPAAVIGSWLEVDFWKARGGLRRPMWANGLPEGWEREWARYGRHPVALAAMQYRAIFDVCRREQRLLAAHQYLELSYEQFVSDPVEQMLRLLAFCGLGTSARVLEHVSTPGKYVDMNRKHQSRFSAEEYRMIQEIVAPGPVTL